jgi:hypothetical protein
MDLRLGAWIREFLLGRIQKVKSRRAVIGEVRVTS